MNNSQPKLLANENERISFDNTSLEINRGNVRKSLIVDVDDDGVVSVPNFLHARALSPSYPKAPHLFGNT
jgi:hypothetical protein